jgi:hypothetical protein
MAHEISWYIPGHVLYLRVSGDLFIEEVQTIDQELIQHLRKKPDDIVLVHLIVDLLGVTKLNVNLSRMSSTLTHLREPTLGWTLLVNHNILLNFVGTVASQVAKKRLRSFPSLQEVDNYLHEQYPMFFEHDAQR